MSKLIEFVALFTLSLVSVVLVSAKNSNYDGYKVVKLIPTTMAHLKLVTHLQEKEEDVRNM
jgi:hypothetical protein